MIMGRPLPPELRARLQPIVLLSSHIDGEALQRCAERSVGCSSATASTGPIWPITSRRTYLRRPPQLRQRRKLGRTGTRDAGRPARRDHRRHPRAWPAERDRAREFLIDLEARTQLYARVALSPKQHEWLVSLAETAAARMPS